MLTLTLLFTLLLTLCAAAPTHIHHRHLNSAISKKSTVFGRHCRLTNSAAYTSNWNTNDGSSGSDTYKYYSGGPQNFPPQSQWMSFEAMFEANRPLMQKSCGWNNWGPDNSNHRINMMKTYIQAVAKDSLVDHRAILAVIMQESSGCLCVPTTNNGVINPGIMQSHNGVAFNPLAPATTIRRMIEDGTQGTQFGPGLVQLINQYGDYFSAFRAYNSGSVAYDGNLSNGNGATPCYVSDIANRLTGWTFAPSQCH